MKITTKTTKEQMKDFLKANLVATKGDLRDRVAYALKANDDKLTRKDLVDLVKEVNEILKDIPQLTLVEPKAENSIKKLAKGVSKKQEIVPEESEESDEEAEETEEAEAPVKEEKPKKKSKIGSKKPKKEGVKSTEVSKKSVQFAEMFPKNIEVGDSKYELASDIKSLEDLHEALNREEEIVFAYYWTKRHLRQFNYFGGMLGQPKSFDNDLDLASAIFVSDEFKISYQLSMYTEAIYATLPHELAEEDGIRIANGTEYQIYRKLDEQEADEESAE